MIRVCFDHKIFTLQRYGGISKYICRLVTGLVRQSNILPLISAQITSNQHLLDLPSCYWRGLAMPPVRRTTKAIAFCNGMIERFVPIPMADVVHESYFSESPPLNNMAVARRVVTVHDMIFERFYPSEPHAVGVIAAKRAAVFRADHIICISQQTKSDLLKYIPINESLISVISHGVDRPNPPDQLTDVKLYEFPYVLFVGDRGGYKNFSLFIKAYAASSLPRQGVRVIAFGGGRFSAEETSLFDNLGFNSKMVLHTTGDDRVLSCHYRNAFALVYPSKYEGFGMPLLEAMVNGCPVICSASSALPEVAGDAALYFSVDDVESLCFSLDELLGSSSLRFDLIARGKSRSSKFSWDECARKTADVYRGVMG